MAGGPDTPVITTPVADSAEWEFHRAQYFYCSAFVSLTHNFLGAVWNIAAYKNDFSGTWLVLTMWVPGSDTAIEIPAYALDSWTRHYVRVRHHDDNGQNSAWSGTKRFYSGTRYESRDVPHIFILQPGGP